MEVTATPTFGPVAPQNFEADPDAAGQQPAQEQESAPGNSNSNGTAASSSAALKALLPALPASIALQLTQSAIQGVKQAANSVQTATDAAAEKVGQSIDSAEKSLENIQRTIDAKKEQLGQSIDSAEKSLEDKVDNGRAWLRQHGGLAGQAISDLTGVAEGIDVSVYDAGKGLVQLADGAGQLANPLEWAANPQANIGRLKSVASAAEGIGKVANLANPVAWAADAKGNMQTASALGHGIASAFEKDPAKFTGNVVGTIGTMAIPGAGAAAAAWDVGRGAELAGDAGRVADVAVTAGKANQTAGLVADGSKAETLADTSRIGLDAADAANVNAVKNVESVTLSAKLGNDDATLKAAQWLKPQKGFYDVIVHGAPDTVAVRISDSKWQTVNQRSLATYISKQADYKGGAIRLASCQTGAQLKHMMPSFAQNLANKMGVPVMAPTDTLFIFPDGKTVIGPNQFTNSGQWKIFYPGN
jgi:hypothetical protein